MGETTPPSAPDAAWLVAPRRAWSVVNDLTISRPPSIVGCAVSSARQRQEVARRYEDHKTLIHPEISPVAFDCQALFTEDQSQTLVVLTVAPRSAEEDKVKLLGLVGSTRVGGDP